MHLIRKLQVWDAHDKIEFNLIMHKYVRLSKLLLWKQPKYRHNSDYLQNRSNTQHSTRLDNL
jgi:hypothetical protein